MPRNGLQPKEEKQAYISGFCKSLQRSAILAFSLTRRRSLVRTQHRPLGKAAVLQVKLGRMQKAPTKDEVI